MTKLPLVSIIIPVYNCQDFIIETLMSIKKQTYQNWECIMVDDKCDDKTEIVIKTFINDDCRFIYNKRPQSLTKGQNSCRNIGFLRSKGEYIKWFDCDDIMLENHLELLVNTIRKNNKDFIISRSQNFSVDGHRVSEENSFIFKSGDFYVFDLILNRTTWILIDFFCRRTVLNNIRFNEKLVSIGDETNFFIRLLNITNKGFFLDKVLTYKRIHDTSITGKLYSDNLNYIKHLCRYKILTAFDLTQYRNTEKQIKWFLSGYIDLAEVLIRKKKTIPFFSKSIGLVYKYASFKALIFYLCGFFTTLLFNKGYIILYHLRRTYLSQN